MMEKAFSKSRMVMAAAFGALLIGVTSLPAAGGETASPGHSFTTPVSPRHRVLLRSQDIPGLDRLWLVAQSGWEVGRVPVTGHLGCDVRLWAQESHVRNAIRGGRAVRIKVDRGQSWCGDGPAARHFDPVAWEAEIEGTVRTSFYEYVYERRGTRWHRIDRSRTVSSAYLDLRWRGVGEERRRWWIDEGPCVPFFGPCVEARPGLTFSRRGVVRGSIRFRGLGIAVTVPPNEREPMSWWVPSKPSPWAEQHPL